MVRVTRIQQGDEKVGIAEGLAYHLTFGTP